MAVSAYPYPQFLITSGRRFARFGTVLLVSARSAPVTHPFCTRYTPVLALGVPYPVQRCRFGTASSGQQRDVSGVRGRAGRCGRVVPGTCRVVPGVGTRVGVRARVLVPALARPLPWSLVLARPGPTWPDLALPDLASPYPTWPRLTRTC